MTGGAGFIGSAVIRHLIASTSHLVVNFDKLTYAGNLNSLVSVANSPQYRFVHGDICDRSLVESVFRDFRPTVVMHLAAESHVDRSIDGPADFIHTNIVGTYTMLEAARGYWRSLTDDCQSAFRFHHISTDEVFGSLGSEGFFTEQTPYDPSSPYSASKASSDHLVRAWARTFGLPVLITNCSNNYGPYQFPEKLIPLMILNALEGKPLPVYGDGQQVRDWLFVDDHARALLQVVANGRVGQTYNIGGNNEMTNLEVVEAICDHLQAIRPAGPGKSRYRDLIRFVADRPGHDQRYAIDSTKMRREIGWSPTETFDSGLRTTVQWYIDNLDWSRDVQAGTYQRQRLGVG